MGSLTTRWARLSARIGRWPRRIAALCCLLLAAANAGAGPTRVGGAPQGLARRLHAGEVAIPLPVSAASAASVQPGNRVGVVAAAADAGTGRLLADRLLVLSVRTDDTSVSGDSGATVVVAGSRSQAVAVARTSSDQLVLIVDDLP